MKRIWSKWITISTFLGNVQMIILLSVMYVTILAVTVLISKICLAVSNLNTRNTPQVSGWIRRPSNVDEWESARRQG